jgi:exosortase/archaeosortase family protein
MISQISNSSLASLPLPVKSFFTKALFLFIAWKLLYHLVLFPIHTPDRQLTNITACATSYIYTLFTGAPISITNEQYEAGTFRKSIISIEGRKVIGIADGCNGLELFVLYFGFLLCFPVILKRLILFTVGGLSVIFILNNLRCFMLAWLYLHNYSIANFAHHYLFKMIIYAIIFLIWVWYLKKIKWS